MDQIAGTLGRGAARALGAVAAAAALFAAAAERDICENKTGRELIRCIEEAARRGHPDAAPREPAGAPPASKPSALQAPAAPPPVRTPQAREDCTGRTGAELQRCLAAGGRIRPDTAVVRPAPRATARQPGPAQPESCDDKTGEALRLCIEAQARAMAAPKAAQPQTIACGGYTRADQALCWHRNQAILECRQRRDLYPDFGVCLRSLMATAPEPQEENCAKLQGRARSHCDARNRVYAFCRKDKLDYFDCLDRQLGPDAVLTRR